MRDKGKNTETVSRHVASGFVGLSRVFGSTNEREKWGHFEFRGAWRAEVEKCSKGRKGDRLIFYQLSWPVLVSAA